MMWLIMLTILNGLCHCVLRNITIDGENHAISAIDERRCHIFLDNCKLCKHRIKQGLLEMIVNVTVCRTVSGKEKYVNVADILKRIPEDTTYLKIDLDNTWQGLLPFQAASIDLSPITRLKQLVYFNLYHRTDRYIQLYPLNFTNETFLGMNNLRVVALDIPIKDQSLQNLLSPLGNLQQLFLQPRGISMKNMSDTIANLHPSTEHKLEILHLSNFQLLGMNGYNSTLNMADFLNSRTFRCVKKLYLKGNSLAKLLPGLQNYFPDIEYIDLSYNLLIDMTNIYSFSQIVTHKTTVKIRYHHQGYVGGSHLTTDVDVPQPNGIYKETFNESNNIFSANDIYKIQCMNGYSSISGNANISIFFQNETARNKVFECIAGRPLDFWIDYLTPLEDYYDWDCILFLKIPIGPHVKSIEYRYVHLEETSFKGFKLSGKLCIKEPNNLTTIDMSGNYGWMPMSKLAETLNCLTAVNGLEHMENIIFTDNHLKINASVVFKKGNFPSLKRLYLVNNSVLIDQNYGFCTSNKLLTHLSLGLCFFQSFLWQKMAENCKEIISTFVKKVPKGTAIPWFHKAKAFQRIVPELSYAQVLTKGSNPKHTVSLDKTPYQYMVPPFSVLRSERV